MTQPVKLGLNVDPNTGGLAIAELITAIADASGLDYVGIQDHPYNDGFTDTFSLITWLAGRTGHVHLFPNVANLPLRPPAMLAKQAATIDVLSGGRFELGLGAGAFADGITGMGGPRRSAGQARGALSEAIDVIRASWAGEPYSYRGTYYELPSVRPGPRPAHDVGLWLGGVGPRPARPQSDHRPRTPRRRPGPGRDPPPLQRHGPGHARRPGPVQRAGRTLGSNPHQLAHRRPDERVRLLAHWRSRAAIPPVRRAGRARCPRVAGRPQCGWPGMTRPLS